MTGCAIRWRSCAARRSVAWSASVHDPTREIEMANFDAHVDCEALAHLLRALTKVEILRVALHALALDDVIHRHEPRRSNLPEQVHSIERATHRDAVALDDVA